MVYDLGIGDFWQTRITCSFSNSNTSGDQVSEKSPTSEPSAPERISFLVNASRSRKRLWGITKSEALRGPEDHNLCQMHCSSCVF